jgi:hypothetical protein
LQVANGEVTGVNASVADPAPKVRGVLQDLGEVEVAKATAYLVALARTSEQVIGDRALLAAMLARDGVSPATLRDLSARVPSVRTAAERWLAALESGGTAGAPGAQITVSPELRVVADLSVRFADRQAALAAATRKGLQPAQLMTVYPRVPDRAMRVELIEWLAVRENEMAREFLKDVVRNAVVLEEQLAALRALANSSDASARNWAAEYKQKHESP